MAKKLEKDAGFKPDLSKLSEEVFYKQGECCEILDAVASMEEKHARELSVEFPVAGSQWAQERKIVYYSDFDINEKDWKSEEQALKIFVKALLDALGESWVSLLESNFLSSKADNRSIYDAVCDELESPLKTATGVAMEYVMLTKCSEKSHETRIAELEAYFEFYGYRTRDRGVVGTLMTVLLSEASKAEGLFTSVRKADLKFNRSQVEITFRNSLRAKDHSSFASSRGRRKAARYFILDRIVTPLLISSERVYETFKRPFFCLEEEKIELVKNFEQMEIVDEMPEIMDSRKSSRSGFEILKIQN